MQRADLRTGNGRAPVGATVRLKDKPRVSCREASPIEPSSTVVCRQRAGGKSLNIFIVPFDGEVAEHYCRFCRWKGNRGGPSVLPCSALQFPLKMYDSYETEVDAPTRRDATRRRLIVPLKIMRDDLKKIERLQGNRVGKGELLICGNRKCMYDINIFLCFSRRIL